MNIEAGTPTLNVYELDDTLVVIVHDIFVTNDYGKTAISSMANKRILADNYSSSRRPIRHSVTQTEGTQTG
jgi:hypothetical protein